MADLAQKLQNATDENLILVLAVQILLGFQLRAPFEPGFPDLPPGSHLLSVAATAPHRVKKAPGAARAPGRSRLGPYGFTGEIAGSSSRVAM